MGLVTKNSHMDAEDAGTHTTVAAVDTVQTDLREVLYVSASFGSTPVLAVNQVTIEIPDQAANPGKITIKTWKPTGAADVTPLAATTFGKIVYWIAKGR